MSLTNFPVEQIITLRKELHKNAELSGHEHKTKNIIAEFLSTYAPSLKLIHVAETGLLAVFDSGQEGKTIMFRADTDALPISEEMSLDYVSFDKAVSHKCGHDGHAAILCGLAVMIQQNLPEKGKVVLIFQPSEETGKGAAEILNSSEFENFIPDLIFALHNLPGFEKKSVIIKKEQFASASKGMIITLEGKSCHAAYPESGVNPAQAFADIIKMITEIPLYSDNYDNFILTTVVHATLGKPAFGTSAGYGEIRVTLRSYDNHNMQRLVQECCLIVEEKAKEYGLKYTVEWADEFDETFNHPEAVHTIERAASEIGLNIIHIPYPFHWSEDFGKFTAKYKGALFGLGAGKEQPELHVAEYDFPDDIIQTGVQVFYGISVALRLS